MTVYQNTCVFSPANFASRCLNGHGRERTIPEDIGGMTPSDTPSNAVPRSALTKRKGPPHEHEHRPRPDLP